MSYDIRRTLFPAMRLWYAELAAGLDGQRRSDPRTWSADALFLAAEHEREAFGLSEYGELQAADQEIRKARAAILPQEPYLDSLYRAVLHERAIARLGRRLAEALALKHRSHRSQRLSPSDQYDQIRRELPRSRRAQG